MFDKFRLWNIKFYMSVILKMNIQSVILNGGGEFGNVCRLFGCHSYWGSPLPFCGHGPGRVHNSLC